jgi:3D (Asp-Asp-Asp) domain-containing protein
VEPTAPAIGEAAPSPATPTPTPPGTPPADAQPADAQPAAPDPSVAGQPEGGAAAAPPVGSGTVNVERLGFSFVTGGPGACGVVLEPWTHVAVSRELLEAYGCGTRVRVTLADAAGDRSSFEGVVGDTMNPLFARTVNVYVGTDEPALEYGVTTGTITPLD